MLALETSIFWVEIASHQFGESAVYSLDRIDGFSWRTNGITLQVVLQHAITNNLQNTTTREVQWSAAI